MWAGGVTNQDSPELGWKTEYEYMAEVIGNAVENNIEPATQDPLVFSAASNQRRLVIPNRSNISECLKSLSSRA